MKLSFVVPLLIAASVIAASSPAYGQAMPRMSTVEPASGKKGDVVAVTGENLDKDNVAKVYLTDGKNDTPVEVTEQTATTIKFKIPTAKAGRLALMILTTGKEPKYIEQPVKVTIEE